MNVATIEWEWEAFSATALDAYANARRSEAGHLWQRALEKSTVFPAGDPRHAASLNNASIACLLAEDYEKARAGFDDALALWHSGLAWTTTMAVSPLARSSLFHLRMEQRHKRAFGDIRRSRNRELLEGTVALSQFNAALSRLYLDLDDAADRLLADALAARQRACGPNNPEFVQIAKTISGRHDMSGRAEAAQAIDLELAAVDTASARSAVEAWRADQPGEMTDMRRLLGAAHLTAMVHERDFL